jgi:hypothetical protein
MLPHHHALPVSVTLNLPELQTQNMIIKIKSFQNHTFRKIFVFSTRKVLNIIQDLITLSLTLHILKIVKSKTQLASSIPLHTHRVLLHTHIYMSIHFRTINYQI